MGKNPSYLPRHVWTVGGLLDAQERVIWSCGKCGAWALADLLAIQREKGPAYSLVDKVSTCKKAGCAGMVSFHYGTPSRPLAANRERQDAARAEAERLELARAKAQYNAVARRLKHPPIP